MSSVLVPRTRPPPSILSSAGLPVLTSSSDDRRAMPRGHQARKHRHPAGIEHEVVFAALELLSAHLDDAQPPALGAVLLDRLLQADHAVADAVQLQVARLRSLVVEQEHGAEPVREELLEREYLAAIAQRVLRQEAHLREAVEDDPGRRGMLDPRHDLVQGLAEFDLGRIEDRLLGVRVEAGFVEQLEDLDAFERPAVRGDDRLKLVRRLGQGDVEAPIAPGRAGEEEAQGECRLAGAGRARRAGRAGSRPGRRPGFRLGPSRRSMRATQGAARR